jgi:hypothetical protein
MKIEKMRYLMKYDRISFGIYNGFIFIYIFATIIDNYLSTFLFFSAYIIFSGFGLFFISKVGGLSIFIALTIIGSSIFIYNLSGEISPFWGLIAGLPNIFIYRLISMRESKK